MPLNELVEINCKEDLEHLLEKLFHENEMLQESVTRLGLRVRTLEDELIRHSRPIPPPTYYGSTLRLTGSITPMPSKELKEVLKSND